MSSLQCCGSTQPPDSRLRVTKPDPNPGKDRGASWGEMWIIVSAAGEKSCEFSVLMDSVVDDDECSVRVLMLELCFSSYSKMNVFINVWSTGNKADCSFPYFKTITRLGFSDFNKGERAGTLCLVSSPKALNSTWSTFTHKHSAVYVLTKQSEPQSSSQPTSVSETTPSDTDYPQCTGASV